MKPLKGLVWQAFWISLVLLGVVSLAFSQAAPPAGAVRPVGAVKAVNANGLTITTDAGTDMNIEVPAGTKIVQVAAGQKDLKSATPIQLSDIKPGDRVLARGAASADGKTVTATSLIVMKQSDIAERQQQEKEDWQKRGIGGLVTAVDPAAGTATISLSPGKTMVVHTSKNTVIRRYSPDSVRFDDAKVATLDQIKPGDQLRARGEKSEDGSQLQAEEIVAGTFRNIAGTVISTDPANDTVTLKDLATKKPVTIRISSDSQLRQLPEMMAQRLAMRLKGGVTPVAGNPSTGERPNSAGAPGGPPRGGFGGPGQGERRGAADLQQILSRMPVVSISDLKKDEAVMVVATEGSASSEPTAITLLTGVEPILSASPNDNRATMLLSPWSLGGGEPEGSQQ